MVDFNKTFKARTELPEEAQKFFQTQRDLLQSRLRRQQQAQQRALAGRLSVAGLGSSGIAERRQSALESEAARQREEGLAQIGAQEQQAGFQFREAERGRQFQSEEAARQRQFTAEEAAKGRAIQQEALDLQKNLALGFTDPNTGQWVRGTAQIANVELDESLRSQVVNAVQALKDIKPAHYARMYETIAQLFGEERAEGVFQGSLQGIRDLAASRGLELVEK